MHYLTGYKINPEPISKVAKKYEITFGLDLAHAIGNDLGLQLNKWQIDFAVWCSYKYLNSGPGGIAGKKKRKRKNKKEIC